MVDYQKRNAANEEIVGNDSSIFDEELKAAIDLQFRRKYIEAIGAYKKIIQNSFETEKGIFALTALSECYEITKNNQFTDFLTSNVKNRITDRSVVTKLSKELEIHWLVIEGKYNEAISGFDNVRNEYSSDDNTVKHALFNEGYVYYSYLNNIAKAEESFAMLEKLYPNDDLVIDSKLLLGKEVPVMNNPKKGDEEKYVENISVKDFELFGNYPNPFNPTTTIKYSLPKISDVELRIFDIMGREIKKLVIGNQSPGYQSVVWDATNNYGEPVSSGIYIYTLSAKSLEDAQTFNNSSKLLLMK